LVCTQPMRGPCTTCTETCGNGVRIGTENTLRDLRRTQVALQLARAASTVVAVGSTLPCAAGLRSAAGASRRIAATLAVAWP
jgi:hypothetical protein